MRIFTLGRVAAALALGTVLGGCFGGGSGTGGGGGGGGGPSFQENYDRVTGMAPTSNMPTTLKATYAGQLRADVTDASSVVAQVEADLNLDVDWTDGQTANPFSGTASNFTGTLVSGETGAIDGTLTVDDSYGGAISRTINPAMTVGGVNVPETQVGALSVTLTGDLSQGGTSADTLITLGGAFFGDGGKAAAGPVVGGYNLEGSSNPAVFDGAIAGEYYVEAQ